MMENKSTCHMTNVRLIELGEAVRMVKNSREDCPETSIKGRAIWETAHNCALSCLTNCPTVDAVEAKKYEELVGMYHELRENFVDFVCSGVPNVAPYCLNRCDGCCDAYGWCRKSNLCKGFNPAEVILYRCAKMDGDGNV